MINKFRGNLHQNINTGTQWWSHNLLLFQSKYTIINPQKYIIKLKTYFGMTGWLNLLIFPNAFPLYRNQLDINTFKSRFYTESTHSILLIESDAKKSSAA